jgi:hypothetical protein
MMMAWWMNMMMSQIRLEKCQVQPPLPDILSLSPIVASAKIPMEGTFFDFVLLFALVNGL